jgi:hypothetical protein
MTWSMLLAGVGGAAMLALGFELALPLGALLNGVCDSVGVALVVLFVGLLDGR